MSFFSKPTLPFQNLTPKDTRSNIPTLSLHTSPEWKIVKIKTNKLFLYQSLTSQFSGIKNGSRKALNCIDRLSTRCPRSKVNICHLQCQKRSSVRICLQRTLSLIYYDLFLSPPHFSKDRAVLTATTNLKNHFMTLKKQ